MEAKAVYRYYAVRVYNTVIIRRTSKRISKIKSMLYKKGTEFSLVQISYIGGKVIGTIYAAELHKRCGVSVQVSKCVEINWSKVKALKPFMQKGE